MLHRGPVSTFLNAYTEKDCKHLKKIMDRNGFCTICQDLSEILDVYLQKNYPEKESTSLQESVKAENLPSL